MSAYSDAVLADSPVAYWRLGEASGTVATDATANGHTGTYNGSPVLGVTGAMPLGDPLATSTGFDISLTSSVTGAALASMSHWTIEAWVKTNGDQTQSCAIFDDVYSSQVNFAMYFPNVNTREITVGFYDGTWRTTPVYSLTDLTWTHVVGTYDGATVRLYINGVNVHNLTYAGTPASDGVGWRIGLSDYSTFYFGGWLEEVAAYSTALSGTRVVAHYNAGITPPPPPAAAQLATGGSRTYNLPDVIASLNDDVNQANTPDTTDTTPFTNLVSGYETAIMVDTPLAASFALPVWGTGIWGLAVWN